MLCRFCLREGTSMRTPFSEFRSAGKPTQANTGSHQNHQVKSHQIMERANKSRQMRSQEKRIPLQKRSVYRDNTNQENCWKSTWPCFCVNSFQAKGAFLLAFTWQRYSLSLSLSLSLSRFFFEVFQTMEPLHSDRPHDAGDAPQGARHFRHLGGPKTDIKYICYRHGLVAKSCAHRQPRFFP